MSHKVPHGPSSDAGHAPKKHHDGDAGHHDSHEHGHHEPRALHVLDHIDHDRGKIPWEPIAHSWPHTGEGFREQVAHVTMGRKEASMKVGARADAKLLLYVLLRDHVDTASALHIQEKLLDDEQRELSELEEKAEGLDATIASSTREYPDAYARWQRIKTERDRLVEEFRMLEQELARIQSQIDDAEREQAAKPDDADIVKRLGGFRKRLQSTQELLSEKGQLVDEANEGLQDARDEVNRIGKQIEDDRDDRKHLDGDIDNAKHHVEELREAFEHAKHAHQEKVKETEKDFAELYDERFTGTSALSRLIQQIPSGVERFDEILSTAIRGTNLANARAEVDEEVARITRLEAEVTAAKREYEGAKSGPDKEELRSLRERYDKLNDRLEEARRSKAFAQSRYGTEQNNRDAAIDKLVAVLVRMKTIAESSGGSLTMGNKLRGLLQLALSSQRVTSAHISASSNPTSHVSGSATTRLANTHVGPMDFKLETDEIATIGNEVAAYYEKLEPLRTAKTVIPVPSGGHSGYLLSYLYLERLLGKKPDYFDATIRANATVHALVDIKLGLHGPHLEPYDHKDESTLDKARDAFDEADTVRDGVRAAVVAVYEKMLHGMHHASHEAAGQLKGAVKLKNSCEGIMQSMPTIAALSFHATPEEIHEHFKSIPKLGIAERVELITVLGIELKKRCNEVDYPKLSHFITNLQKELAERIAEKVVGSDPTTAWQRVSSTMNELVHKKIEHAEHDTRGVRGHLGHLHPPVEHKEEGISLKEVMKLAMKAGSLSQLIEIALHLGKDKKKGGDGHGGNH